ncbi:MAG: hypothetical protein ACOCRX_07275 [Candidatus Woesearchaeota archaeon]
MKVKLANIKMMEQSLNKLVDKELDIRVSFKLSKILRKISEELEDLEKARQKLVKKYSDNKEKENLQQGEIRVSEENQQAFYEEYAKLMEEEIDLDIDPISIDDLQGVSLSPKDISFLTGIIIKDDDSEGDDSKDG